MIIPKYKVYEGEHMQYYANITPNLEPARNKYFIQYFHALYNTCLYVQWEG